MGFIKDFHAEIKDDSLKYIEFDCTGAIDYIEYIRIELRKEQTDGFTEIHPCDFFKKIYIPHLGAIIRLLFMKIFGYMYQPFDNINSPDLRIYYKCYKYLHHSHDWMGKDNRIIPMTLDETMDYVKKEKFDIGITNWITQL